MELEQILPWDLMREKWPVETATERRFFRKPHADRGEKNDNWLSQMTSYQTRAWICCWGQTFGLLPIKWSGQAGRNPIAGQSKTASSSSLDTWNVMACCLLGWLLVCTLRCQLHSLPGFNNWWRQDEAEDCCPSSVSMCHAVGLQEWIFTWSADLLPNSFWFFPLSRTWNWLNVLNWL